MLGGANRAPEASTVHGSAGLELPANVAADSPELRVVSISQFGRF